MPQPARIAYDSFGHNIKVANGRRAELTVALESRLNRIPLWGPRRRLRIESELQQVQGRIADYNAARAGIESEDYTLAINILLREADKLARSETPYETAQRVAREPAALGTILNSPNGIATRMRKVAGELESLSN